MHDALSIDGGGLKAIVAPMGESDAETVRGSYKQPGGKLVSATVAVDAEGRIAHVAFDGDYFAERADGRDVNLASVAEALVGLSVRSNIADLQHVLEHAIPQNVRLVGIDAQAMAFAVARAAAVFTDSLALHNLREDEGSAWASVLPDRFPENSAHPNHQIPLTPQLIAERWEQLDVRLEDPETAASQPYEPAMQMALDDVIARRTARGDLPPILRFWEWAGPAVILGLNQSVSNEVDLARARELGIAVVRRVTGGGAMFVEPGNTITYSLTAPLSFVAGLSADDSYGLCESWTFSALHSIGIAASHEPINDISSPAGKIGGAAQRRYPAPHQYRSSAAANGASDTNAAPAATPAVTSMSAVSAEHAADTGVSISALPAYVSASGAVLHHTTMAYDIDANKMLQVLRINKEKMSDKAVKSAAKRVDPMKSQSGMSRRQVLAAFSRYLHENIPHIQSIDLPADVIAEARELAASKFSTPEWTHRIP
jgi:lipoate-protein ligase A